MKKLISFLLTACMVVTLTPMVAFGTEPAQADPTDPAVVQIDEEAPAADVDIEAPAVEEPAAEEPADFEVQEDFETMEDPGAGEATDPQVKNGWIQNEKGKWQYFENDVALKGFLEFGDNTYYCDENAIMKVGLVTIPSGRDKGTYYFNSEYGRATTPGTPGCTYGLMVKGWLKNKQGRKRYFDQTTGKMLLKFQWIDGKRYYFIPDKDQKGNPKGFAKANAWLKLTNKKGKVTRYYFGGSGAAFLKFHTIKGSLYYFSPNSGVLCTSGFKTIDGKKYYLDKKNGKVKLGWFKYKGKKYFFKKSGSYKGSAYTGMHTINGSRYFFSDSGVMQTGIIKHNGKLYYFQKNGKAINKGWFTGRDGKRRYCYGKGRLAVGTVKIGTYWYEFSTKSGALLRTLGDDTDRSVQSMSSSTSYLILVKKSENKVRIYRGTRHNWNRIYKFSCGAGRGVQPPVGSYTVKDRGQFFETYYYKNGEKLPARCWYYTKFTNNLMFHSVVYDDSEDPVNLVDGGLASSDGCVRLSLDNAKWINNYIPTNTKVVVSR